MNRGEITVNVGVDKTILHTELSNLRIVKCATVNGMIKHLSYHPASALTLTQVNSNIYQTHIHDPDFAINVDYDTTSGSLSVSGVNVESVTFSFK